MAHLRWKWSTIILMKAKINRAIRKPRHGTLGIGTGIEIGTDITNAIISRSIRPMTPRLSRWWLRMRGPHPQSHMTLQYRVTRQIRNVISPLLQDLWTTNLAMWRLRMRRPYPQSHLTFWLRGHVTNQKSYVSTYARPMPPRCWLRMMEPHPKSYVTLHPIVTWKFKTVIFPKPRAYGRQT